MVVKKNDNLTSSETFVLKRGRCLGKYRLNKRLGGGGFSEVWKARDSVEGIDVALKIPLADINGNRDNNTLLREIRSVSRLRHENILSVKNADIIAGHAVIATELSVRTLAECSKPMSSRKIVIIIMQVLKGLCHAHHNRIVHCDVNPNNIFLFSSNHAKLGDFGISIQLKGRSKTIDDYGTPGYVAPEQAYGYPVYSSDTFAVGLILYEYITGILPRWPNQSPFRRYDLLREKTGKAFVEFIKRSTSVDPKLRFANASEMLKSMTEALPGNFKEITPLKNIHKPADWQKARTDSFEKKYSKIFPEMHRCIDCNEPISESMKICPWCGSVNNRFDATSFFDYVCPDCHRGILPQWSYCPWCYGKGFEPAGTDTVKKVRYHGRCNYCNGKLMWFMRYCPSCRRKVKHPWQLRQFPEVCGKCGWSVDTEYWNYCPWCKQKLID